MQWRIVHIGRTLCVCVCVEFSAFRCSLLHIVSLLMSEKRIDAVSLSFLWVPLSLSSSPPLSPAPLSLRCEWGEARWVAMSEGMQQWGRWSLISQWKVYFSLVNRHGCISLSLTPPAQSPSFPLHFYSSFLSLPPPFSLSLSASYLELYRGQIEGIIFLRLSFSAMRWYWRSHSAPVSKINQKHFSTAAINALALFQQLCLFPLFFTHWHTCTQFYTHTFSSLFLPKAMVLSWTLTSDSLPPAVHSSGRDLHLICISLQI